MACRSHELLEAMMPALRRLGREWLRDRVAAGEDPAGALLAALRAEGVPLEGTEDLLRALHILYLYHDLDPWILALAVAVYAGAPEAVRPLLEGDERGALAAAAARSGAALLASYHLNVGMKVVREILAGLEGRC